MPCSICRIVGHNRSTCTAPGGLAISRLQDKQWRRIMTQVSRWDRRLAGTDFPITGEDEKNCYQLRLNRAVQRAIAFCVCFPDRREGDLLALQARGTG